MPKFIERLRKRLFSPIEPDPVIINAKILKEDDYGILIEHLEKQVWLSKSKIKREGNNLSIPLWLWKKSF